MPENYCPKCKGKQEAICIDCLQKDLVDWSPLKSLFFYAITDKYKENHKTNLKCKNCGKQVNICSSCYCKYIHDCLQKEDQNLAEEFAVFFI